MLSCNLQLRVNLCTVYFKALKLICSILFLMESYFFTCGCTSRFTPEAKARRHPFVYLPFGAGPRNCVGMRLAQLEMKMALVHLFRRFSIVACAETKVGWQRAKPKTLLKLLKTRFIQTCFHIKMTLRQ